MKERLSRKLELSKETVRALSDPELSRALGGRFPSHPPCEFTTFIYNCTDPSVCSDC